MTVVVELLVLLFEVISFLICLSLLYGEKFKIDKATITIILVDVAFYTLSDLFHFVYIQSIIMYLLLVIYCGVKYGWRWKALIVNVILLFCLIGVLQSIYLRLFYNLLSMFLPNNLIFLIGSIIVCLVFFLYDRLAKNKLYELSRAIQEWNPVMNIILLVLACFVIMMVVIYKMFRDVHANSYLIFFLYTLALCMILGTWHHFRIKRVEMDAELQCYDTYFHTYEELISIVRMRQHEFDNHLNAILGLQYSTDSYEELKEAQKKYIEEMKSENRHNKLLKEGNPFYIGYLYSAFQNLSAKDIQVDYLVKVGNLEGFRLPIHKLIEVSNDLITNAAEAVEHTENRDLYIRAVEDDEGFILEVMNRSAVLSQEYIEKCFEKGYSSKGKNRGLGLYNVREICDKYNLELSFSNRERESVNWVCFGIYAKKLLK